MLKKMKAASDRGSFLQTKLQELLLYIKLDHLIIITASDEQEINSSSKIRDVECNTVRSGIQEFIHHLANRSSAYIGKRDIHLVRFSNVELNGG